MNRHRTNSKPQPRPIDTAALVFTGAVRAPSLDELATGVPLEDRLAEALTKLDATEHDLSAMQQRLTDLEAQAAPTEVTR